MVDFSYYDAAKARAFNFQPMQQAAEAQSEAYREAAKSIAQGLYKRREFALEKQKLDVEQQFRQAQEKHYEQMEEAVSGRTEAAKTKAQLEYDARLQKLENDLKRANVYTQGRLDVQGLKNQGALTINSQKEASDAAAGKAMAEGGGLSLSPDQAAAIGAKHMAPMLTHSDRMQKLSEARDAFQQHQAAVVQGLDEGLAAKTLTKEEHQSAMAAAKGGDLKRADGILAGAATKKAGITNAGYTRDDVVGQLRKMAQEALLDGDTDRWKELNSKSSALSAMHGPDAGTIAEKMLAESAKNRPDVVQTAEGKKVPDPLKMRLGGFTENMSDEQKQWLDGYGMDRAGADHRMKPLVETEKYLKAASTGEKGLTDGQKALMAETERQKQALVEWHKTRFLIDNGWQPGAQPKRETGEGFQINPPQQTLGPGPLEGFGGAQAAPAGAPPKAAAAQAMLKQIQTPGAFKSEEEVQAALKAAGLTEDDIHAAAGGG